MKRFLLLALASALLCTALCVCTFAADFTIGTADQFVSVMNNPKNWDDNITLTADIDLTGKKLSPIGDYDSPFTGTFDGAGFTVSGVQISTDYHAVGLFGVIKNATVKNVTVDGEVTCTFGDGIDKFSAETKVDEKYSGTGAVVGVVLVGSTLENVVNKAVVFGAGNTGGVAGMVHNVEDGTINLIGCANYGTVDSAVGNVGGVFGRVFVKPATEYADPSFVAVTVDGCTNYAELSFTPADRHRGGGVVGYVRSASGIILIQNCRNEGNITGINDLATGSNIPYVGGIIGRNEIATAPAASITIKDCINTGNITSSRITGGITAYISNGEANTENPVMVTGCVNLGDVQGSYFAAGIVAYAELNSITKPHFIENCFNAGHISFDFLDGYVFEPSTSNQEAAGGIIARNRGASVKNCVNLGVVDFDDDFRVLTGALVGKMDSEMAVPAEITDNYYLYSRMVVGLSMFPNTSNVAIGASGAADKANYPTLDLDGAWVMTDKGPAPAQYASEAANITIADVEIPAPVVETTAPVTETEPVEVDTDNGGFNALPVIIAVVVVLAVAAAVAVVLVIKKKK